MMNLKKRIIERMIQKISGSTYLKFQKMSLCRVFEKLLLNWMISAVDFGRYFVLLLYGTDEHSHRRKNLVFFHVDSYLRCESFATNHSICATRQNTTVRKLGLVSKSYHKTYHLVIVPTILTFFKELL